MILNILHHLRAWLAKNDIAPRFELPEIHLVWKGPMGRHAACTAKQAALHELFDPHSYDYGNHKTIMGFTVRFKFEQTTTTQGEA